MKTGFTCGCFDMMHAGHMRLLKDAKSVCDRLIVGVQRDPTIDRPDTKNAPIQTYEERIEMVIGCKYVDDVVLYDTEKDLYNLLQDLNPDVRVLGTDYTNKQFTGDDLEIEIYYHKRDHSWSSTDLRNRVFLAERHLRNISGCQYD